jgi:hypothetical protein
MPAASSVVSTDPVAASIDWNWAWQWNSWSWFLGTYWRLAMRTSASDPFECAWATGWPEAPGAEGPAGRPRSTRGPGDPARWDLSWRAQVYKKITRNARGSSNQSVKYTMAENKRVQ